MDLSEVNTDVDIDALRESVDDLVRELKEWGEVCDGIVQQLGDVSGSLDAEDWQGAISDALANVRLLDWSGPQPMESLLPGKLNEIESSFEELTLDIATAHRARDAEEEDAANPLKGASTEALWHELGRRVW